MPSLIPVIDTHEKRVRIILRRSVQNRRHALRIRQVPRLGLRLRRVQRIHIEVLIPIVILDIQDKLGISRPEIGRNRPLGRSRQRPGGAKGLGSPFDVMYLPSGEICAPEISGSPKNSSRSNKGGCCANAKVAVAASKSSVRSIMAIPSYESSIFFVP